MPRIETVDIAVPTSVATGGPSTVGDLFNKTVQISGTFVATLQLQGSINGSDFVDIGAAQTAPALLEVSQSVKFLRIDVTAFTSGVPAAVVSGFNQRAL